MSILNFLTAWISLDPLTVTQGSGRVLVIIFVLLFLVGMALRVVGVRRKKEDAYVREMFRRLAGLLTTMGILGMIIGFFSFEDLRFLGARFWYPIWLIVFIIWAFFIIRYIKKQVPMMRAREIEREEKFKYMPKPKKK